ncbi:MAG: polysaccharide deacetylase family protein [Bacteroidota bacterium]|nr:polysaccharide deacetylase family protein [Bacteroidota bacterium]
MIFYSDTTSPRLQYVIDFLSQYFNHSCELTTDKTVFLSSADAKINYSSQRTGVSEIWIKPVDLIFENKISPVFIKCFTHESEFTAFFETDDDIGFDMLAAIFYLLSRYEEYLPHKKDLYGRYAHENSLAFQYGFLHQPLINTWLGHLRKILADKNSLLTIDLSPFTFLPTYDIDIAWGYKNKGFLRNTGGLVKSMVNAQWSMVKERLSVLVANKTDPYDVYEWLDKLHEQYNLQPIYFFHVGEKKNKYDKNISVNNKNFRGLIQNVAANNKIGLHPSWRSGDQPLLIGREKKILENITSKDISASRQHYIRLALPHTYRQLIQAGISDDYSMGYGSVNGFRASITTSFYWYDLEKEEQTSLLIHPFCFMDANAFFEQKLSPEQALDEILSYYKKIKNVNGQMVTIWHNTFLGTDKMFKGWREVYEKFIRIVSSSY